MALTGKESIEVSRSTPRACLVGPSQANSPSNSQAVYELVLNLQTADDLGLTFPSSLMAFADDIVERDRIP